MRRKSKRPKSDGPVTIKVAVWRLPGSRRWGAKRLVSEILSNLEYEGFYGEAQVIDQL